MSLHTTTEQKLFNERIAGDSKYLTFMSILKMAEHISATYKFLGKAPEDYEWQLIGHHALEHLELTEYDFEGIIDTCREQGIGNMWCPPNKTKKSAMALFFVLSILH